VLGARVLSRIAAGSARGQGQCGWSRRACLALLAGASASVGLGWNGARAQEVVWQELRRDDLGFRIEMPGTPTLHEEKGTPAENLIRSISGKVEYQQIAFGVSYTAFMRVAAEEWFKRFSAGLSALGRVTETPLAMSGFPAREFTTEGGIIDSVFQSIVVENATITVSAAGGIASDPMVRRFLDSFMLLRTAP
jgi:hypothetical protein